MVFSSLDTNCRPCLIFCWMHTPLISMHFLWIIASWLWGKITMKIKGAFILSVCLKHWEMLVSLRFLICQLCVDTSGLCRCLDIKLTLICWCLCVSPAKGDLIGLQDVKQCISKVVAREAKRAVFPNVSNINRSSSEWTEALLGF